MTATSTRPTTAPAHQAPHPVLRRRLPGVLVTVVAALAVLWVAHLTPTISPLVLSLLLGAVIGSLVGARSQPTGRRGAFLGATRAGTDWVASTVLRVAVVLLGLQLSIPQMLALGWQGLVVIVVAVGATFSATLLIGRWLRVPRVTTLLVATGFSICGAAAVSAMKGVVDDAPGSTDDAASVAERDDALAGALALVTIYGSLAIFVVPWLAGLIGLDDHQAGLWIGASTQEVAQVVAAAGTISATALATATVAKLARVALLAPLVTGAGIVAARRAPVADDGAARPRARVPWFVVGFVVAVLVRSTGVLPDAWVTGATHLATWLFVAAMFAMGLGVDLPHLVRTGRRVLALGALSWLVILTVSLTGVLLLT
ncbi:putative integral membrane protein (TIGR00698 family) [Sediminihabitans luteus]|uniref:Putative integral membrane protein (TIGR00698 family) n=1 Tax=Sediminihabitans luteus TaxID=1138585 RepID=A0A2M9CPG8_9CELL|nr:putative sulfate exporter family transporter [Sediminihabitans luteus]PJJ73790.1 putative integral membrane protein (TIGR00698 family) [Sediminihabitans luteus]GIJ00626.1 membrane protein [Sediminihabitans luteus]